MVWRSSSSLGSSPPPPLQQHSRRGRRQACRRTTLLGTTSHASPADRRRRRHSRHWRHFCLSSVFFFSFLFFSFLFSRSLSRRFPFFKNLILYSLDIFPSERRGKGEASKSFQRGGQQKFSRSVFFGGARVYISKFLNLQLPNSRCSQCWRAIARSPYSCGMV